MTSVYLLLSHLW